MITVHYGRGNFWLRLKQLLNLGKTNTITPASKTPATPKHRPHRCTTFLEMP